MNNPVSQTTAGIRDMFTDRMYVGLRDGRCVAIAREMAKDTRENGRTRAAWAKKGLDVLTVAESDMGPYYDDMKAYVRERDAKRLL